VAIFIQITRLWRKYRLIEIKKRKLRGLPASKRRFPIIPVFHLISCVVISVFFVLSITDSITAGAGTSYLVMIGWVTPFCIIEGIALRKMVSLGRRLIPWNGAMLSENISGFDRRLSILWVIIAILFSFTWIFGVIGCFVATTVSDRLSLFCLLFAQLVYFISLIYQVKNVLAVLLCFWID